MERSNRTLLDMLATTSLSHPFDWEDQIPKVCMAYNTSIHASSGYTPFFLMFGRQARLPVDLVYGTRVDQTPVSEYALATKHALEEAYRLVREKLDATHCLQKSYYDKKVHGKPFMVGDLVWLHSPVVPRGHSKKLHHPWSGPYRVTTKLSESDYRVKKLTGRKTAQVVHFDRLKLCNPGTRFQNSIPAQSPSSTTPTNSAPDLFGQNMEPLDNDDYGSPPDPPIPDPVHQYPTRSRAHPDCYGIYRVH